MPKRSFSDYDDFADDPIFDEDLADFEHFAKRPHQGKHGDRINGDGAQRRGRKHHRRNSDDPTRRS